jgi:hypothetical protein
MKLIIVDRSKPDVFARLRRKFSDDVGIEVLWERRTRQRRRNPSTRGPERRSLERRKFTKPWNGRDYIVIHIAK